MGHTRGHTYPNSSRSVGPSSCHTACHPRPCPRPPKQCTPPRGRRLLLPPLDLGSSYLHNVPFHIIPIHIIQNQFSLPCRTQRIVPACPLPRRHHPLGIETLRTQALGLVSLQVPAAVYSGDGWAHQLHDMGWTGSRFTLWGRSWMGSVPSLCFSAEAQNSGEGSAQRPVSSQRKRRTGGGCCGLLSGVHGGRCGSLPRSRGRSHGALSWHRWTLLVPAPWLGRPCHPSQSHCRELLSVPVSSFLTCWPSSLGPGSAGAGKP